MGDLTEGNGGGEERRSAYCQRNKERSTTNFNISTQKIRSL
jgi:hypothetical protein